MEGGGGRSGPSRINSFLAPFSPCPSGCALSRPPSGAERSVEPEGKERGVGGPRLHQQHPRSKVATFAQGRDPWRPVRVPSLRSGPHHGNTAKLVLEVPGPSRPGLEPGIGLPMGFGPGNGCAESCRESEGRREGRVKGTRQRSLCSGRTALRTTQPRSTRRVV